MTTPLPTEIPTVRVHGQYRGPDGRALAGTITFTAPGLLTFPASDLFIGGPVVATLDETGAFSVTLPATDAPQMNPSGWAWAVKENLAGIIGSRSFALLLPKAVPDIDLADVAPADPTTPNYVPVPGSQILTGSTVPAASLGLSGDFYTQYDVRTLLGVTHTTVTMWKKTAGTWAKVGGDIRGSQWFVNTATTPSTDAKPGDILLRSDTGDIWQRGASGWGSSIGNLKGPKGDAGTPGAPGSKVYAFANGSEASGVGVPDDFAIRTDTGTLYQYVAGTGWTSKGSIKGPKGDTGATGTQGPKGDPGNGSVNSVNTKLGPDVVLTAGDVGALPASGTASLNGTLKLTGAAGTYRHVGLQSAGVDRWQIQLDGTAESGGNAGSNVRISARDDAGADLGISLFLNRANRRVGVGTLSLLGDSWITSAGAIGARDLTADPAAGTGGVQLYAKAGKPYVMQGDGTVIDLSATGGGAVTSVQGRTGAVTITAADVSALATTTRGAVNGVAPLDGTSKVPTANLPDLAVPDVWQPADLGLKAWAFDPGTALSTPAYTGNGSLRFTAVVIRETTSVSKIAFHFGGYSEKLTAGSWAAIYTTAGVRRATTADMVGTAVVPGVHNAGGATVGANLTASVSLAPGVYYIAYVFRYAASDGPMLLQLENGFGAPPNVFGLNGIKRFGVWNGTVATTAPANIDPASIDNGANRFWAGLG
ncbi:hypothetical protein ABT160_25185 [Streptomyces sp. NPDC001941]|uniref:hypothetical protein n=1 Tax=Streptomyces sp. NPDC001941 TaxID=3154659 RepID=UPI003323650F